MLNYNKSRFSIKNLIELNLTYPRELTWSLEKQELLIDSIFKGICIGSIHLLKLNDRWTYQVIDGVQRLRTITKFLKEDGLKGANYYDERDFLDYALNLSYLEDQKLLDDYVKRVL